MKNNKSKQEQNLSIPLTRAQFLALLKVVYLGNWMANANRDGSRMDPHEKKYEEIENYIFSFAKQFDFNEYVDDEDAKKGKFFPTRLFEEGTDVGELMEEYNEENFWDELIHRLGERDFSRRHSAAEIKAMTRAERFEKLDACINAWADEIDKNGMENMWVLKK
jgi:hypothetical protein